jgi:hypothetical protein
LKLLAKTCNDKHRWWAGRVNSEDSQSKQVFKATGDETATIFYRNLSLFGRCLGFADML